MAQPVEKLTLSELQEENKRLMKERSQLAERMNAISAEVARRMVQKRADGAVMGMTETEIDALESSVARMKERRKQRRAEDATGDAKPN